VSAVFLVVVLLVGCVMIFMRRGYWPRKTLLFGIGAALAYLILANVTGVAELFWREFEQLPGAVQRGCPVWGHPPCQPTPVPSTNI
jgi:hypothetical protein